MKGYVIWDCHLNPDTHNFGGLEYVVDGERGRRVYPGSIPECLAKRLYACGIEYKQIPAGFCDGCSGDGTECKMLDCRP